MAEWEKPKPRYGIPAGDNSSGSIDIPYLWIDDGRGPVLKGRWIRVVHLQFLFNIGKTPAEIADKYIDLTEEQVLDAQTVNIGGPFLEIRDHDDPRQKSRRGKEAIWHAYPPSYMMSGRRTIMTEKETTELNIPDY